jgi:hypothetical protein
MSDNEIDEDDFGNSELELSEASDEDSESYGLDDDDYYTDSSEEEDVIEEKHIYNDNVILHKIPDDKRMTSSILSEAEYTNLLGTRAQQIASSRNEPIIFVDVSKIINSNSHNKEKEMAREEIINRKCPYKIRRLIPPNFYEEWDVNEMTIIN